ncbi:MAG TPA: adenylate/guanylate cyclase domain-containing protein [Kiritimatiellia bacterium]|nr:adenylate/guanylate cyclase domain-containing protein [Kiritimatiellia bacterium]HMP32839.1 adenylate/guanylate cyclase domain-containing protein [Kiritimatiellia bacterium]
MKSLLAKPWIQAVLIGLISTLVALLLWFAGKLDGWENTTWAWRVTHFAEPSAATDDIKVILLDQSSLDWAANEMGLPWPWMRETYAAMLDFCRRGGAKVIAFDVLFTEPSAYMVSDDVLFGEHIGQASNFVTAVFLGQTAGQTSNWPAFLPPSPVRVTGWEGWLTTAPEARVVEPRASFPVPEIATPSTMMVSVREELDGDNTFRRAAPLRVFDGQFVPMLGLGAYLVADRPRPYELDIAPGALRVGDKTIPIDSRGRVLLKFRGPSGTHETLSAKAVLQSELRIQEGGQPVIDPEELRGKYILFGFSAPGLKDLKSVPLAGDYPGVEVHATFLDNLLAQDFMQDAPRVLVILFALGLGIVAALLIVRCRTVIQSVAWAGGFILLPYAAGYAAYPLNVWWPIQMPALAVLLAIGLAEIVNYATEGRQKRFIKSAFKQYLSSDVIEQILVDPSQLKLGGEKRELSIFFSDLQGFSAISEKLGPVALTALLNDYLTDMSDIIMEEGGTVDKYEGDAIIAFWNAPMHQTDHAVRACRAALRCQRKLAERRKEFFDRTGVDLYMRIGIHTGEVVVGNMGSNNRFNYTVLGDAANLASRLEGANKQFGTYLMVSEVTWSQAESGFTAREIGSIMVVGRKAPVRVFDVLGLADEDKPSWLEDWHAAMLACRAKRWSEARDLFARFGDDPLARKYRDHLDRLLHGDLAEWDGIWKLTEK